MRRFGIASSRRCKGIVMALVFGLGACSHSKAVDPAVAQLAYQRGFEAVAAGDWLRAEQYLVQAKQAFPEDPYVLLNLGVVAQHLGRFEEAKAYYLDVVDKGADEIPKQVTAPEAAGKSLADLAREDLATLPEK